MAKPDKAGKSNTLEVEVGENPQTKMRVIVTIKGESYPELWRDLVTIPRDQRSERMRVLATVGAQLMHSGLIAVPVAGQSAQERAEHAHQEVVAPPNPQDPMQTRNVSGGMKTVFGHDGGLEI